MQKSTSLASRPGERALRISSVIILSATMWMAHAREADSDLPGSADYQLLKRYPHSHIVRYESTTTIEPYRLILGNLKKVNNVISPEAERQIEGLVTRITYRIPDGKRSEEVFEHFRNQLVDQGAEILFSCRGRDCGSSNYWANRIFEIATLYGPEQFQNFAAARALLDEEEHFISVYTVQRGNRRLYAHIEIATAATDRSLVESEQILQTLVASGRYPLVGVEFDSAGRLTDAARRVLGSVALALNADAALRVYVVGHLDSPGPLDQVVARSKAQAEQVVAVLISEGMDPERLTAAGVGPLAPSVGLIGQRIELVTRRQ